MKIKQKINVLAIFVKDSQIVQVIQIQKVILKIS